MDNERSQRCQKTLGHIFDRGTSMNILAVGPCYMKLGSGDAPVNLQQMAATSPLAWAWSAELPDERKHSRLRQKLIKLP